MTVFTLVDILKCWGFSFVICMYISYCFAHFQSTSLLVSGCFWVCLQRETSIWTVSIYKLLYIVPGLRPDDEVFHPIHRVLKCITTTWKGIQRFIWIWKPSVKPTLILLGTTYTVLSAPGFTLLNPHDLSGSEFALCVFWVCKCAALGMHVRIALTHTPFGTWKGWLAIPFVTELDQLWVRTKPDWVGFPAGGETRLKPRRCSCGRLIRRQRKRLC